MSANPAITIATQSQNQGADPARSIWVSANAGTGKTRVLTSRILRLLIDGAGARDIMAVTYTRAAAAEMRDRLFTTLAKWAIVSSADLDDGLKSIGIIEPTQKQKARARQLFATLLDQPIGIRIETIHAFAQSVLRRFPIEAGVEPRFDIATDAQKAQLQHQTIALVMRSPEPLIAQSVMQLVRRFDEKTVMESLARLMQYRPLLAEVANNAPAVKKRLYQALGAADAADDPDSARLHCLKTLIPLAERGADLMRVADALEAWGGVNDKKRAKKIRDWCAIEATPSEAQWAEYAAAFLTSTGQVSKRLAVKAVAENCPDALTILSIEAEKILAAAQHLHGIDTARQSFALLTVAEQMLAEYSQAKIRAGLMDYDDLINHTRALLGSQSGTQWVKYKLDNGINYLLIDEAQDTSLEQWEILSQLADAFFDDDEGQKTPQRSLFSVGDFKQSIYSFQGAKPELFIAKAEHFNAKALAAHKAFETITLNTSFRSTKPILQLVDAITATHGNGERGDGIGGATQHQLSRIGEGGFVEILDCVTANKDDDTDDPQSRLAQILTAKIKAMIGKQKLPSKGRVIRAGDILVLVRNRVHYAVLDRQLRLAGLPVAGADRVKLNEDIAVLDLLALGRVVLLPDDDLSLATVLKSPLFGLSEEALFTLAYDRGRASLFHRLAELAGDNANIAQAHERFITWLDLAERESPYAFYWQVLSGDIRRAFARRLGNHIHAILAEFLDMARGYERLNPASMIGFLHFIEESDAEITREASVRGDDEIRLMTIHGAKGLESPIVILPDTLRARGNVSDRILPLDDGCGGGAELVILPASNHPTSHPIILDAIEKMREHTQSEANRLFYVALTRAEDGLIVAGFEAPHKRYMEGSWYEKISTAMDALGAEVAVDDNGNNLRRLTTAQEKPPVAENEIDPPVPITLPQWLTQSAPNEPTPLKLLTPSQILGEVRQASPVGEGRRMALERGRLAHRMLEILPTLQGAARHRASRRLVAATTLPLTQAQTVLESVLALMATDELAVLFSPKARTEVPISGRVGAWLVSGVIDRLLIADDAITVVDFKTGTPPTQGDPQTQTIPQAYIQQMALYRAVLMKIWQDRPIHAGLVYVENARLYWVDAARLDEAINNLPRPS